MKGFEFPGSSNIKNDKKANTSSNITPNVDLKQDEENGSITKADIINANPSIYKNLTDKELDGGAKGNFFEKIVTYYLNVDRSISTNTGLQPFHQMLWVVATKL